MTPHSLCPHTFERYRHDCDVCRHTRKIGPRLKTSALLKLISEAQGTLVEKVRDKKDLRNAARRERNLHRFQRSLAGEHTRVRRSA